MTVDVQSPMEAAHRLASPLLSKEYEFQALHVYTDFDGSALYWRIRLKHSKTGEKWIRPMSLFHKEYVLKEPEINGQNMNSLYNFSEILRFPQSRLWIVEGEWAADWLNQAFKKCSIYGDNVAVTSGGASSAGSANWDPAIGHEIVIWPDNDEDGLRYAEHVTENLKALKMPCKHVDVGSLSLPSKGDAVDWLEQLPDLQEEDFQNLPFLGSRVEQNFKESDPDPILFLENHGPEISPSLIPGVFGEFALALSEATETPATLATLAVLGCLSTACNGKFEVQVTSDWKETVNLYILVALPPGSRKSPVFKRCRAPIEQWEKKQHEIFGPDIQRQSSEYQNQVKLIQKMRDEASRKKDELERRALFDEVNELSINLKEPDVLPRMFTTDVTNEALGDRVAAQGGRFAILSDEAGVFEVLAGLYSNGKSNLDVCLKGWDGGAVRIDRRGRAVDCNPLLVMLLTIQPKIISKLGREKALQGNGFMERFLWAIPKNNLGYRQNTSQPLSEELEDRYAAQIIEVLDAKLKKRALILDHESNYEFLAFRNAVERELRPGRLLHEISGWGSKLPGEALRIAGLLHIAEHGVNCPDRINRNTLGSALQLAACLREHAVLAYNLMGAAWGQQALGRRIAEFLPQFGLDPFSLTQLRRAAKNVECLQGEKLKLGLNELAERNYIFETPGPQSTRGRKTRYYRNNSKALGGEHKEHKEVNLPQVPLVSYVPGVLETSRPDLADRGSI